MTKSQILKLLKTVNFDMTLIIEAGKNRIEIGQVIEGRCCIDKTHAAIEQIRAAGIAWGGYFTGYNSFIASLDSEELGDWNDTTSAHHY